MKVESAAQKRARENAEIRARRAAAEQRKRAADERARREVEGAAEGERKERQEQLAWIRDIDPFAADAAKVVDECKALVRRLEDRDDEQELARARKYLEDRKATWVVQAATHPRLRHLVSATEREAYAEELRTPVARALADWKDAEFRRDKLRADPHASATDVAEAEATDAIAHARWRLEIENANWEERQLQRAERAGVTPHLSDNDRKRRKRIRKLEAFLTAGTGVPPKVESRRAVVGERVKSEPTALPPLPDGRKKPRFVDYGNPLTPEQEASWLQGRAELIHELKRQRGES